MKQFEALTRYISLIEQDEIGHWHIDKENDGTPEHPFQFPFVIFSELVQRFTDDVYTIVENRPELELNHYGQILEQNGITWDMESMRSVPVENLDARCICALLVGAIRAERFCDGALLSFFKDRCISRWLQRLRQIDEEK